MKKNKLVTGLIVVATIVLAGVAIYTATRLYQSRQGSIAPTAPESVPEAATFNLDTDSSETTPESSELIVESPTCTTLAFTISTSTPTPTPTPTSTSSSTPSPTATPTGPGTPGPTVQPTITPTPAEPALPQAGIDTPTTVGVGAGILILLFGLVLAL